MRIPAAILILLPLAFSQSTWAQIPGSGSALPHIASDATRNDDLAGIQLSPVAQLEGVHFVNHSSSQIILEKDGKRYLINTQTQSIHELELEPQANLTQTTGGHPATSAAKETKPKVKEKEVYYTEDIVLWTLPTTHHLERKSLIVDFTHRFSYDQAFEDGSLSRLLGLDGFSISSFGFTYGVTDTFFAGIYRVPTALGRIIQVSGGAQLSQESNGNPFSSTFRVGVEGANHFSRNFVTTLEFAIARSVKKRAQLYLVPTISFNSRPIVASFGNAPKLDGETNTAIGAGFSVDFRPTVAFIAEAIQRTSGLQGVHRPAFMFGIQKKLFRHSFTLGLTNSPGTTMSQRSATRASLFNGADDTFGGLTLGFNLSRRLF